MSGSCGKGKRTGVCAGGTTSPWRQSMSISRRTSKPGRKGMPSSTTTSTKTSRTGSQRKAAILNVGNLIAMHSGLIGEQTNREGGDTTDQWQAKRCEDRNISLSEEERQSLTGNGANERQMGNTDRDRDAPPRVLADLVELCY